MAQPAWRAIEDLYVAVGDDSLWAAACHRARQVEQDRGVDAPPAIGSHMKVATRLHGLLMNHARAQAVLLSALQALPLAVLIVDAAASPIFAHERAQAILGSVAGAGLSATDPVSLARLMAPLAGTVRKVLAERGRSSLLLTRPDSRSDAVAIVTSLSGAPGLGATGAVIHVVDPDASPVLDEAMLRSLYGLTRAEARLAAILLRGKTLDEASGELYVSLATVKTHLQRIFMKTDTTRQAQLLRLLMLGHVFNA